MNPRAHELTFCSYVEKGELDKALDAINTRFIDLNDNSVMLGAFQSAFEQNSLPTVQFLISHCPNIHIFEEEILYDAIRLGNTDIIQAVLDAGANLYTQRDSVSSPLWLANTQHCQGIAYLLSLNIDVEKTFIPKYVRKQAKELVDHYIFSKQFKDNLENSLPASVSQPAKTKV